jgi:hypothetical protein
MEDIHIDLKELRHDDKQYMELIRITSRYKLWKSDLELYIML